MIGAECDDDVDDDGVVVLASIPVLTVIQVHRLELGMIALAQLESF